MNGDCIYSILLDLTQRKWNNLRWEFVNFLVSSWSSASASWSLFSHLGENGDKLTDYVQSVIATPTIRSSLVELREWGGEGGLTYGDDRVVFCELVDHLEGVWYLWCKGDNLHVSHWSVHLLQTLSTLQNKTAQNYMYLYVYIKQKRLFVCLNSQNSGELQVRFE